MGIIMIRTSMKVFMQLPAVTTVARLVQVAFGSWGKDHRALMGLDNDD
jgi:hypothetical protein